MNNDYPIFFHLYRSYYLARSEEDDKIGKLKPRYVHFLRAHRPLIVVIKHNGRWEKEKMINEVLWRLALFVFKSES